MCTIFYFRVWLDVLVNRMQASHRCGTRRPAASPSKFILKGLFEGVGTRAVTCPSARHAGEASHGIRVSESMLRIACYSLIACQQQTISTATVARETTVKTGP